MNNDLHMLKKQIDSDKLSKLYLFFGEEEFLTEYYTNRICEKIPDMGFPEFNRIKLDGKSSSASEIADSVETFPMMAERKVVIISESGAFGARSSQEIKNLYVEMFKNLSDDTVIIIQETNVDKRNAAYKAAKKYGTVIEFTHLNDADATSWLIREARNNGKTISKQNAMLIASYCERDLRTLKSEMDKLSSYAESEITESDIIQLASKSLEAKAFDLCDHIMNKNTDKALSLYEDLITNKENPFAILYLLYSSFEKLLKAKLYSYLPPGELATVLGVAPFFVKKYSQGARNFSEEELIDLITLIPKLDLSIKRGEISQWQSIESIIFKGCRRNKK